jgi:phosphatidylcholine synthase
MGDVLSSDPDFSYKGATALQRSGAWAVHFYTATGAVMAFAAVLSTIGGRFREAFLWLVAASIVDATDGFFARLAEVKRRVPQFDGGRLDDIVDYLTYVFVPVLMLHQAGLLPPVWGVGIAGMVLLSSAYGFAAADAKSDDYFFTGFPSYWNIVAVYLFAAALPPVANAVVLAVFAVLVFVRTGYVYPSRTPVLRGVTTALGAVWAVMIVAIIFSLPDVPRPLLIVSLFFPVYYGVLSFILHRRRDTGRRGPSNAGGA